MRRPSSLLMAIGQFVVLIGCNSGDDQTANDNSSPGGTFNELQRGSAAQAAPRRFVRMAANELGIDFENEIDNDHPWSHLYATGTFAGGGVCVGDYDGDGLPDVFLSSQTGRSHLYRQHDVWQFEDASSSARLVDETAWTTGASFADVNNDGLLDLYVCNYQSPNRLYINRGGGKFREEAQRWGMDFSGASVMGSFADYDRDGDLDCYLVTNRIYPLPGESPIPNVKNVGGVPVVQSDSRDLVYAFQAGERWKIVDAGQRDYLLRNDGDRFVDVTSEAGLDDQEHLHGLAATWWDFDNDGDDDLYVSNDFWGMDHLYVNQGDGTFRDAICEAVPHTPWFSMGADAADINNDGLLDFLAADMSATTHLKQKTMMGSMGASTWFFDVADPPQYMRNALYLNTGTRRFQEIAYMAGVASTDWTWSVKFGDLDNDGHVDLYVTNGTVRSLMDSDLDLELSRLQEELFPGVAPASLTRQQTRQLEVERWKQIAATPTRPETDLAFRNAGGDRLKFDVNADWGLNEMSVSFGAAMADLDRDGDLDLIANRTGEPPAFFRNDANKGNGLILQLSGRRSNRWGIGARVTVESSVGTLTRQLRLASGYQSADEPLVHIGVGDEAHVAEVTIDWPSGARQTVRNLPTNQLHVIEEPEKSETTSKSELQPMFRPAERFPTITHRETPFDDFSRQPLLPHRHSQLGPPIAWGDVDGDGDDDLYVGGAAGNAGELWTRQDDKWVNSIQETFIFDAGFEDMVALFFDLENDGDLDLFAGSGSSEWEIDAPQLRSRLYLNDGNGNFKTATDTLPDLRTPVGAAAACDFDRDGDVDLFVGGRVIPGQYPHSPKSFLLRNDEGTFHEATEELATELGNAGMVTGALFSDVNNDGLVDLLLSLEWGPVKCFVQQNGKFHDRTAEVGLSSKLGWWNSIVPADVNSDGKMDYVVGNFGLNTKYHASDDHPALLYYGDLDGSGALRLVEAEFEHNRLVPIRGRSCSSHAMPFIKEKFPTYRAFGLAALDDIYTQECLDNAKRLTANELRSGIFVNRLDGDSLTFEFQPLPRLAQIAPLFGIVASDLNADGHLDLALAQNFFSLQVETGNMDGGLGLLLLGNGSGEFEPQLPRDSGVIVPGEAKAITVCDLNDDQRPDLLVSRNNNSTIGLKNCQQESSWCIVRLSSSSGVPVIGARVTANFSSGRKCMQETNAGAGCLSQSSSSLFFGDPSGDRLETISVTWPDGQLKQYKARPNLQLTSPSQVER